MQEINFQEILGYVKFHMPPQMKSQENYKQNIQEWVTNKKKLIKLYLNSPSIAIAHGSCS